MKRDLIRVIVIVQLVTHYKIPNLNSGLVPVDPGGLVYYQDAES